MHKTHHQSFIIIVAVVVVDVLWTLGLLAGVWAGDFEKYDQPKALDLGELEADLAPLKGNSLGGDQTDDQAEHPCPFSSKGDADDNDDWQIIDLPHKDPQFHHIDHLPMKLIDYSWPSKSKSNKYSPPETMHIDHQRWKKNNNLDGRKLFLEKKFHYKSKLMPPANLFQPKPPQQQQPISEQPLRYDSKKSLFYGKVEQQQQQPILTMIASHKSHGSGENLDQPNDELLAQFEKEQSSAGAVTPVNESPVSQVEATRDVMELNYANRQQARATNESVPSEQTSRVRESFQAAAELARQLENQQPEQSRSASRNDSRSESVDQMFNLTSTSGISNFVDWDVVEPPFRPTSSNSSSIPSNMADQYEQLPRYLGFGQVYKTDNSRSSTQQARLSCSFGPEQDLSASAGQEAPANMTISDVQWARFVGNYDPEQAEPSFECKFRTCRVMEVKNDIWTTVHPRPAVQHYLGGRPAPSYSLTLHQVDPERHIGVYRCSAMRQMGDRKQLVYRIVPFT